MLPQIHVITPVYNAGALIAQSIASFKEQTYGDRLNFIIHDDGSTDDTIAIARTAIDGDPRFILTGSPVNEGNSIARIKSLETSIKLDPHAGVVFIDGDGDTVHPEHVERGVLQMQKAGANICMYNCTMQAMTPELEYRAAYFRQNMAVSEHVGRTIRNLPRQSVTVNEYPEIILASHLNATKIYGPGVKQNLHCSPARRKQDTAFMSVFADPQYRITALPSDFKSYTYNIRSGSVTDFANYAPHTLQVAGDSLLAQLDVFLSNVNLDNPHVNHAARLFLQSRTKEQLAYFQKAPEPVASQVTTDFQEKLTGLQESFHLKGLTPQIA